MVKEPPYSANTDTPLPVRTTLTEAMDINRPNLRVAFGNCVAHLNGSDVEPLILEVEIAADP